MKRFNFNVYVRGSLQKPFSVHAETEQEAFQLMKKKGLPYNAIIRFKDNKPCSFTSKCSVCLGIAI